MTGDAQGGIGSDITSVADVLAVSEAVANGVAVRAHTRLWCRGHAKTGWKLEPGVYRWPKVTEVERLRRERHLTQDFRVFSADELATIFHDFEGGLRIQPKILPMREPASRVV